MFRKIGTLLSVGAIAFILYIFIFYIEGETGVVLAAFFIAAPLISLLIAYSSRKRITVEISCDAYVKKKSEFEVDVTVTKNGKFPIAVAEIQPEASAVFENKAVRYRISALSSEKKEFTYKINADVGGNGEIFVRNLYSCGFLGFIRFRLQCGLPESISVGVIPEIPDVKTSSALLRQISDSVFTSDSDEECDTEMTFSANSAPGYEHREYVQGDPLKRVNWKLSSKKSKLMVRLDEAVATVQPLIILDLYRDPDEDEKKSILKEEKLIQSVFGLLKALVKQGISCNFAYSTGIGTAVESVDNPNYPDSLLLKILAEKVVPARRIDVSGLNVSVCSCVIATTKPGGDFSTVSGAFRDCENVNIISPGLTDSYKGESKLWYLDDDDNFKVV
ncbi:MAG: DUF58 domain-containing protein [Ruminococcus sp.]|nr:DUF58 domain-containing protein [Ruminococcus sp.]